MRKENHCQRDFAIVSNKSGLCCEYHNRKWGEFIDDCEYLNNMQSRKKYNMTINELRNWHSQIGERLFSTKEPYEIRVFWASPDDLILKRGILNET